MKELHETKKSFFNRTPKVQGLTLCMLISALGLYIAAQAVTELSERENIRALGDGALALLCSVCALNAGTAQAKTIKYFKSKYAKKTR